MYTTKIRSGFRRSLTLKLYIIIAIIWIFFIARNLLLWKAYIDLEKPKIRYVKVAVPLPTKYILLWQAYDDYPFYIFTENNVFAKNNCSYQNCVVLTDRDYFKSIFKFDAIAINGRKSLQLERLMNNSSRYRESYHQKYIFVSTEAPRGRNVSSNFDNVFNWTLTYKLNSDIPYPYIKIRDWLGRVVGPKKDTVWKENMTGVDVDLISRLRNKNKDVAWLVSNCKPERMSVAKSLQRELQKRGYSLDIYGACGPFKCASNDDCNKRIEEYYFFLAFENTVTEDYITEKVLRALSHYTVPVVYGGANYSRYLPPGSYLDARCTPPDRLASHMIHLMKNPHLYRRYFGWRRHYTFHYPMDTDNVCGVCAALNNPKLMRTTEYPNFRKWWLSPEPSCDKIRVLNDERE